MGINMSKKMKLSIILLNLYTTLLIGLFLNFNHLKKGILFSGLLLVINIAVYSVMILSNRKEIRVHLIVGKSKRKELIDGLVLNGGSHFISIILFESFSKLMFDHSVLVKLCLFSIALIIIKMMALSILLRKII